MKQVSVQTLVTGKLTHYFIIQASVAVAEEVPRVVGCPGFAESKCKALLNKTDTISPNKRPPITSER